MTEPSQYFKGRTVQEQMNEVIGYVDTRAAEVATAAIASDVAQVHQDMLDADADASAAAASATAAAGTLANAVKKTGEASQSIAGDIAVAGDLSAGGDLAVTGDAGVQGNLSVLGDCDFNNEVKVRAPVNNTDAANKKYVDDQDALLIPIADVNQHAVGLTGNQNPIAGDKTFVGQLVSNFNRINRIIGKITSLGEYIFAQIPNSADNTHRVVIDYVSRSTGISKIIINTNLSGATLTATAVYNSAQNVPVFNLYTDSDGNQYLGSTCVNNDIIEISGGTFHMRGSSTSQQLTFMSSFTSATGYNKITNN